MKEYRITDNKKACLILAILFWGLIQFFEFGAELLLKMFPRELLVKYIDPVFYSMFFLFTVIVFRKALFSSVKDFIGNAEKYLKASAVFFIITLVLMVASAIFLDSVGIGESSNQEAIDEAVNEYGTLQLVIVCFIGPFVEEIFYRGILFGILKGKGSNVVRSIIAVVITALYWKTDNILCPILVHVCINSFGSLGKNKSTTL